jgi:hypothetical protein
MRAKEQEERGLTMVGNPLVRRFNPSVRQVFIPKAGGLPSGVESDAAYSIMNRRIMTMRPIHLQLMPMCNTGGVIFAG